MKKARNILTENIDKLHEISKFLLEKETITGEEFMEILNLEDEKKSEIDENTVKKEEVDDTTVSDL